jgi:hypothetical protein
MLIWKLRRYTHEELHWLTSFTDIFMSPLPFDFKAHEELNFSVPNELFSVFLSHRGRNLREHLFLNFNVSVCSVGEFQLAKFCFRLGIANEFQKFSSRKKFIIETIQRLPKTQFIGNQFPAKKSGANNSKNNSPQQTKLAGYCEKNFNMIFFLHFIHVLFPIYFKSFSRSLRRFVFHFSFR